MPYKSIAQERFFHSSGAEKAGIGKKTVKEWDQATKGKKLPRKLAKGGQVECPKCGKSHDEDHPHIKKMRAALCPKGSE